MSGASRPHSTEQSASRSPGLELEELIGFGVLGLIRAADSRPPGEDITTWTRGRIRGYILDAVGAHGKGQAGEALRWILERGELPVDVESIKFRALNA